MSGLRRTRLGAVLSALVAVAGCASVPTHSEVVLSRAVDQQGTLDESEVRVLPPLPSPGESPQGIVAGFLAASANFEDDHAIARQYLTADAAARWNADSGVVEYADAQAHPGSGDDVDLTGHRVATLDRSGSFRVDPGALAYSLHLTRVGGEWRLDGVPDGLLLSEIDIARSFRQLDVYYLDRTGQVVVPDRVFFEVPRNGLPTALVRRLLAGPSSWLAPAVRTDPISGVHLLGNVPVAGGIAQVNLSRAALGVGDRNLAALSAQLIWTLRQLPSVTGMRLLVDGNPIAVTGAGQPQSVDDWPEFSPDVISSQSTFYFRQDGALRTGQRSAGAVGFDGNGFVSPAVAPGGDQLAALSPRRGGTELYTGQLHGRLQPRFAAAAMTAPSYDHAGNVWLVATDRSGHQQLVRVAPSGRVSDVPAPGVFTRGTVTSLRISRDGARVALSLGAGAASRLYVATVTAGLGGPALDGLRAIAPGIGGVSDVSWQDADNVIALGHGAGTPRRVQPIRVTVDGSQVTALPLLNLPACSQVAAGPGGAVVVASGGAVWQNGAGAWLRVATGSDPSYPG